MFNNNMRNTLLVSIVTALGLIYFNSAKLATGQIVTLGLAAFAWLGMLYFSSKQTNNSQQTIQSNQLLATPSAEANPLSADFVTLLNTFQTELREQISATEAELSQIKSLMDDAIDDLVDSFISLEASTRTEQNLVMLLISNQKGNTDDELNPFRDKQIKSQQFLLETSKKINKQIADNAQNEALCSSLTIPKSNTEYALNNINVALNKLAPSTDSALINEILESAKSIQSSIASSNTIVGKMQTISKRLSKQSKEISHNVAYIIEESNASVAMVADEISITSAKIEKDVQTAVQSLQFQDMTTQLVTQCGERQQIMQKMLNTVNSISQNNLASEDSIHTWQTKLAAANEELKLASKVRMKEFNVDAGSIELF